MTARIAAWLMFAVLAGLYVYMVVAAVGNLTLLPEMGKSLGLTVNAVGWFWLWFGVLLPALAFAVAALISRGRGGGAKLLVFATALAVAAAIQLEVSLVVAPASFFM